MMKSVHKISLLLICLVASLLSFGQKKANNIALVMPFCSKQILANPDCYDAQLGNMCREYYQGALIALDSLEQAHIPLRVSVYDTENDSLNTYRILQKTQLKEAELIIGPVLQGGNKMISNFVKEKGIYHVSPLMTFSKTRLSDPYWVSVNPDIPSYAAFLYSYITSQAQDSMNIIVVSDKSSLDKNFTPAFNQIVPTGKQVKIKIVEFEKGTNITSYFSTTLPNHIIIPSSNEASVNAIFRTMKDSSIYTVFSYGFSQWLEFKNTDYTTWLHKNTHIVTPYFVNYEQENVKRFVASYRERFFTEPTEAAFKGYGQMLLFGTSLAMHGKNFMTKVDGNIYPALHTTYAFKRQKEGDSYQNSFLNIIRLDEEMQMKRVN